MMMSGDSYCPFLSNVVIEVHVANVFYLGTLKVLLQSTSVLTPIALSQFLPP